MSGFVNAPSGGGGTRDLTTAFEGREYKIGAYEGQPLYPDKNLPVRIDTDFYSSIPPPFYSASTPRYSSPFFAPDTAIPFAYNKIKKDEDTELHLLTADAGLGVLVTIGYELIGKLAEIFIPDSVKEWISGRFGRLYFPTAKDRLIYRELAGRRNVLEAMNYLAGTGDESVKIKPDDAFEYVVRYMLTRRGVKVKDVASGRRSVDGHYGISFEEVNQLVADYRLGYGQMELIAELVAGETGQKDRGQKIIEAIREATLQRSGDWDEGDKETDRTATRTYESRRRLEDRLAKTYGRLTDSILSLMVKKLEVELKKPGFLESGRLKIDFRKEGFDRDLEIDLSGVSARERGREVAQYRREWRQLLREVKDAGRLSGEHKAMIRGLMESYPAIEHYKRLSGFALEEMIEAQKRGESLAVGTFASVDPNPDVGQAIQMFLQKLKWAPHQTMGLSIEGKETIIASMDSNGHDGVLSVYDRNCSCMGPYTFFGSEVVYINGRGDTVAEPALVYDDRRGHRGMVSRSEIEGLQRLAGIVKDSGYRETHPDIFRAFFRFINDLDAAARSIEWTDAQIGTERSAPESVILRSHYIKIFSDAYWLRKELPQRARMFLEMRRSRFVAPDDFGNRLNAWIGDFSRRYADFFPDDGRKDLFKRTIHRLGGEITTGSESGAERVRLIIRRLVRTTIEGMTQDVGERLFAGNVRTMGFGDEVVSWLSVARSVENKADLDAILERLVEMSLLRANQDTTPSMELAAGRLEEGRLREALYEFYRVCIYPGTEVSQRINAAARVFEIAEQLHNPILMTRALSEMEYLVVEGHDLTPSAKGIVESALRMERVGAGMVRVPEPLARIIADEAFEEAIKLDVERGRKLGVRIPVRRAVISAAEMSPSGEGLSNEASIEALEVLSWSRIARARSWIRGVRNWLNRERTMPKGMEFGGLTLGSTSDAVVRSGGSGVSLTAAALLIETLSEGGDYVFNGDPVHIDEDVVGHAAMFGIAGAVVELGFRGTSEAVGSITPRFNNFAYNNPRSAGSLRGGSHLALSMLLVELLEYGGHMRMGAGDIAFQTGMIMGVGAGVRGGVTMLQGAKKIQSIATLPLTALGPAGLASYFGKEIALTAATLAVLHGIGWAQKKLNRETLYSMMAQDAVQVRLARMSGDREGFETAARKMVEDAAQFKYYAENIEPYMETDGEYEFRKGYMPEELRSRQREAVLTEQELASIAPPTLEEGFNFSPVPFASPDMNINRWSELFDRNNLLRRQRELPAEIINAGVELKKNMQELNGWYRAERTEDREEFDSRLIPPAADLSKLAGFEITDMPIRSVNLALGNIGVMTSRSLPGAHMIRGLETFLAGFDPTYDPANLLKEVESFLASELVSMARIVAFRWQERPQDFGG